MTSLLPNTEKGYLPWYLIYCGSTAILHAVSCFTIAPKSSMRLFSGPQAPEPTGLQARIYGTKNVYTGAIRLATAYSIANTGLYDLGMLTFVGVLALNLGERFGYGTEGAKESIWPFVTAGVGLVWMGMQRAWYLA